MFRSWFGKKPVPLSGAPAVRRLKSYSAGSGFVYQYTYEGQRPLEGLAGLEFVFSASADRKTWQPVSIAVEQRGVRAWERTHARTLSSSEWYALAKMALFAAFDERATPADLFGEAVPVREPEVTAILQTLGLE